MTDFIKFFIKEMGGQGGDRVDVHWHVEHSEIYSRGSRRG